MKRVLLSVLALCGMASAGFAADMPVRTRSVAPAAVVAAPVANWAGWYLGGNIGWAKATWKFTFYDDQVPAGGSKKVDDSGIAGGLTLGYNWQAANWVFGVEGDYQFASLKSDEQ